jgi:hypothetical protein
MRGSHASGPLLLIGAQDGTRFYEYRALDFYTCFAAGTATSFFAGAACLSRLPRCGRGFVAVVASSDGAQRDALCFRRARLIVLYKTRGPTWAQLAATRIRVATKYL